MPPGLSSRAALAVLIFLAGLALYSRNASFPARYHPDEPDKVAQVLTRDWNFHHPLLLLQTASVARALFSIPPETEAVVRLGRWISAAFAAGAAAFLALLAWELADPRAGLAAGLLVIVNTQFFELAHYFKEDTSLAFGTALFAWLFTRFWGRPSILAPLAMGASLGLAASAKYAGLSLVILPLAILFAPGISKPSRVVCFFLGLAAFLAVTVTVNFPMLQMVQQAAGGITREVEYAVDGHMGITRKIPHGVYIAVLTNATNPGLWFLLALYALSLVASLAPARIVPAYWRHALGCHLFKLPDYILTAFIVLTVVGFSFVPKTHHRYMLPITGLLIVLATVAAFRPPARLIRWFTFPAMAAAILFSCLSTWDCLVAFGADTRAALQDFLKSTASPDTLIVTDRRVGLPEDFPFRTISKRFAADAGSLADLRAAGPTLVVVTQGDFGRFLLKNHSPTGSSSPDYWRRSQFYLDLFASGELVWQREPGRLPYLQPGIRVYQLNPP
ncbi:MAG: hypothetical protein Fur0032_03670 [Terrimicrobiaceae bacterium]